MQTAHNILLVEDNEGDVEMVKLAFRDGTSMYQVWVANDGEEAMDFLYKRRQFADVPVPQLILLDLNLPRMDGKRFLEVVKTEAKLKSIPVIMLTSSQSPSDMRACYERQANCYVLKPFDVQEFAETVRQVVMFWSNLGRLPSETA
ncbi:MAG: response regulator [Nitrospira sp.]